MASGEGLRDVPMYFLPGNHDPREVFFRGMFPGEVPAPPAMNVAFEHKGVRFVCVDWGAANKAVATAEMEAHLAACLADGMPTVVLSHHNVGPVGVARLDGLAAASCYYGGNIAQMIGLKPKCPTICHFGAKDAHIPLVGAVDKIQAAHPDIPVHVYDAGHGFARKNSADYDASSDALAFERTIALFGKAG